MASQKGFSHTSLGSYHTRVAAQTKILKHRVAATNRETEATRPTHMPWAVQVRRIRTSSTNKRHVIFLYACAEHVEPSCAARSRFSPQLHNTGVDRAALLPPAMKSPRVVRTSWVAGHLLQQEVRRAGRRAPLRRRRAAFPQEPARLGLRGPAPCARRSAAEKVCGIDEALAP